MTTRRPIDLQQVKPASQLSEDERRVHRILTSKQRQLSKKEFVRYCAQHIAGLLAEFSNAELRYEFERLEPTNQTNGEDL
jgi:hypothetical protein